MCGGTEKPCGSSVLSKWGWEQWGLEEMDFVAEPSFLCWETSCYGEGEEISLIHCLGSMVQGCHILAFYTLDLGDLIVVTQHAFDVFWSCRSISHCSYSVLFLLVSLVYVYLNCQNKGN